MVDHVGIEPMTSRLRTLRSPEGHGYTPQKAGTKIVLPFGYNYTHVSHPAKTDTENIIRTFVFSAALRYNVDERRRRRCEIRKAT